VLQRNGPASYFGTPEQVDAVAPSQRLEISPQDPILPVKKSGPWQKWTTGNFGVFGFSSPVSVNNVI
jgi:hypothetical protein